MRQILIDGTDVRVSLSTCWSCYTIGFYKINENPHLSFEKALCQNYNIPRLYAPYDNLRRRAATSSGNFNFSSPGSGEI